MKLFLEKDPRVEGFFEFTETGLNVYDALPTDPGRNLEYVLKLATTPQVREKSLRKVSSLLGLKVAIDPGHFGGPFSHLEERYIDIPPSLERNQSVQFDEGTLSFLTACYLRTLLEKEGAIVFLTRNGIGQGAYSRDFFSWMQDNPQLWSPEMTLRKLFRYYNLVDLHARAEKINAFEPDLSVVIHYNSHHGDPKLSSNSVVTPLNFNLVFVPGAFLGDELFDPHSRYEFLRLLVTRDVTESLALSQAILSEFTTKLNIPIVSSTDGARYLEGACLKCDEGVYARNLALTRLVHGPICYGETLVQNNIDECLNLSRKDFVIAGKPCSSRIKEVAEAYFEGIKQYALTNGN